MSLSSMLNIAQSGLMTSQTQLRLISDNIANVNTPGYARKLGDQQSVALSTTGGGVSIQQVTRSVDQYLSAASYAANAQSQGAGVVSDVLDQAQSLFGDPSTTSGYFNQLDQVFSAFSAATQNASSTVSRNQALNAISGFLDQSSSISQQLQQLGQQAGSRINDGVTQINSLLSQIDGLNKTIVAGTVAGADTTDPQNTQAQLINTLSGLMDVNVSRRSDGGLDIRGGDGALLVGRSGASQISFTYAGAAPGQLQVTEPGGTAHALQVRQGLIAGLVNLRNTQIPAMREQLGEYVSQAVDQINAAHNASSAVPPPNQLNGRNTGLDLPTAVSGFTGKTEVAITDSSGVLQSRVDIDFDAGTMSTDGGPAVSFTPATFLTTLNGALGSNGAASFSGGALSLKAASGDGVSIADDPTTPSSKAGRGFSQFFGLNDLITSTGFPDTQTGLQGSDPNGFNAGGVITLRISDGSGTQLKDAAITVPAGGTVDDMIAALNANAGGVGLYGAFSLDSQGALSFTATVPGAGVSVISDTTQRGAGGPSATALFGLDASVRAQRATSFSIRSDIAADSTKLSLAQLDTTAAAGQSALSIGDGRGAALLAAAGSAQVAFDPAGAFGPLNATLSQYASQFSGTIAQQASIASSAQANAASVSAEADSRRASVEGVNLDQELINLTTYQQSYNASARLIQAVSDIYDVLLKLT